MEILNKDRLSCSRLYYPPIEIAVKEDERKQRAPSKTPSLIEIKALLRAVLYMPLSSRKAVQASPTDKGGLVLSMHFLAFSKCSGPWFANV